MPAGESPSVPTGGAEGTDGGGPGERIRAFLALPLDLAARTRLARSVEDLRPRLPGCRLVSADGWHLTLRFLGPSTPAALQRLTPLVREAAAACPAGLGRLGGLGLFPERGSPRVLWLGVELPEPVRALQTACEAAAQAAGFSAENRPFRAHLTLGRWRDRGPRPQLPLLDLGAASLAEVVLFRSDLRPQGALHTALEVFPLARS